MNVLVTIMIIVMVVLIKSGHMLNVGGKNGKKPTGRAGSSPIEQVRKTIVDTLPYGEAPEPSKNVGVHSHDRLDNIPDAGHDESKHWKEQLDGFLKAGIIDKAEYKALYEQRKKCFHNGGIENHK